jgi:poly-gamma-glutamate capsule biosynthesis protein CapA/YwtB (metallophosphatase superfamily)
MRALRFPLAALAVLAAVHGPVAAQRGAPPELATTVRDGFTLASVGDLVIAYPSTATADPAFGAITKLIRDADVATANYEANIIDGRSFRGSAPGGFAATPDTAADVKAMGFDLVARSNNHIGEYGYEGLVETNAWLDKAGLVYAGSGETYWAARAPRFVSTPKGRVGMVATASSFAATMMAQPGRGEWPGRGGQSALRTRRIYVVPPAMWQAVQSIRHAFPTGGSLYPPTGESDTEISILGNWFRRAAVDKPYYSYDMNKDDLRDILAMVREGKAKSDFMTVAIHAHETHDTGDVDIDPSLADFLPQFAKACIDAGADAFLGTGVHVVRGIEIYKGRPIFYGLGEFFRQMDVIGLNGVRPIERGERNSEPIKYEGIVAVTKFDRGTAAEVRLYPTDLNRDAPLSQRGVPKAASPQVAQRVLERLQALSAPLGTTIAIEGNVGVIRPKPASPSSQAQH